MNQNPEQKARDRIDSLLTTSGWIIYIKHRLPQSHRPHQRLLFDPDGAEVMGFDPTEFRIIHLMCEDTGNADIAAELKISNITLKRDRAAIMEKAGVKTNVGLFSGR